MNRATNSVAHQALFNFERVPEGVEFIFELTLRLYDRELDPEDARKDYRKVIARGLELLEKEGIGGKISAGYGKIQFKDLKWDGQPFNHKAEAAANA